MKIRVWSFRPFFDLDNHIMDWPGQPTFDPKHPATYPGLEVVPVETLSAKKAIEKYGKQNLITTVLYTVTDSGSRDPQVTIWKTTGKSSKDIVED